MKKKIGSFLAGLLTGLLVLCSAGTVWAVRSGVSFNGYHVALNGERKITAGQDIAAANGQPVPSSILYTDPKGGDTNYLPVRAISELLGVKIGYNGATHTVLLGGWSPPSPEVIAERLLAARDFVEHLYRSDERTVLEDFTVISQVRVADTCFPILWSTNNPEAGVRFSRIDYGRTLVDINTANLQETEFDLIAGIQAPDGRTVSVCFPKRVPANFRGWMAPPYEEIVEGAYRLPEGTAMTEERNLYGKVVNIESEYTDKYKNCTLTIQVGELVNKPIKCFCLSGEGVEHVRVGDRITVRGILKNYKGTIEFDKGCMYLGQGEHVDLRPLVNAAYKMEDGMSMPDSVVLKGVISKVNSEFNPKYNNVTVTIVVDGMYDKPIECFRLEGQGADTIKEGDEIAVVGTLKNYKGTIEFEKGCKLVPVDAFLDVRTAAAAYALVEGMAMAADSTVTGVISAIDTEFNPKYNNITVTIVPGGMEEYKIQCFRLTGVGADKIKVGDRITVTGRLKNYKGTIEFEKGCVLENYPGQPAAGAEPNSCP